MEKILISSCFLGNKVRYDGGDNLLTTRVIQRWQQQQRLVVICPELAGGLSVPRAPAEIQPGNVIQVITNKGEDVTAEFTRGANAALMLCKQHNIRFALLKESSPSCGSKTIYDGSFTRQKISGQGITSKLLKDHGINVYGENDIAELSAQLATIDDI